MKKYKIYLETTLFNYYFDSERPAHAETVEPRRGDTMITVGGATAQRLRNRRKAHGIHISPARATHDRKCRSSGACKHVRPCPPVAQPLRGRSTDGYHSVASPRLKYN